jgi:hypothetical protein
MSWTLTELLPVISKFLDLKRCADQTAMLNSNQVADKEAELRVRIGRVRRGQKEVQYTVK